MPLYGLFTCDPVSEPTVSPVLVLLTAVGSRYLVPPLVHDGSWLINSRCHRERQATTYALNTRVSDAFKPTGTVIFFHGETRERAGENCCAMQCDARAGPDVSKMAAALYSLPFVLHANGGPEKLFCTLLLCQKKAVFPTRQPELCAETQKRNITRIIISCLTLLNTP